MSVNPSLSLNELLELRKKEREHAEKLANAGTEIAKLRQEKASLEQVLHGVTNAHERLTTVMQDFLKDPDRVGLPHLRQDIDSQKTAVAKIELSHETSLGSIKNQYDEAVKSKLFSGTFEEFLAEFQEAEEIRQYQQTDSELQESRVALSDLETTLADTKVRRRAKKTATKDSFRTERHNLQEAGMQQVGGKKARQKYIQQLQNEITRIDTEIADLEPLAQEYQQQQEQQREKEQDQLRNKIADDVQVQDPNTILRVIKNEQFANLIQVDSYRTEIRHPDRQKLIQDEFVRQYERVIKNYLYQNTPDGEELGKKEQEREKTVGVYKKILDDFLAMDKQYRTIEQEVSNKIRTTLNSLYPETEFSDNRIENVILDFLKRNESQQLYHPYPSGIDAEKLTNELNMASFESRDLKPLDQQFSEIHTGISTLLHMIQILNKASKVMDSTKPEDIFEPNKSTLTTEVKEAVYRDQPLFQNSSSMLIPKSLQGISYEAGPAYRRIQNELQKYIFLASLRVGYELKRNATEQFTQEHPEVDDLRKQQLDFYAKESRWFQNATELMYSDQKILEELQGETVLFSINRQNQSGYAGYTVTVSCPGLEAEKQRQKEIQTNEETKKEKIASEIQKLRLSQTDMDLLKEKYDRNGSILLSATEKLKSPLKFKTYENFLQLHKQWLDLAATIEAAKNKQRDIDSKISKIKLPRSLGGWRDGFEYLSAYFNDGVLNPADFRSPMTLQSFFQLIQQKIAAFGATELTPEQNQVLDTASHMAQDLTDVQDSYSRLLAKHYYNSNVS